MMQLCRSAFVFAALFVLVSLLLPKTVFAEDSIRLVNERFTVTTWAQWRKAGLYMKRGELRSDRVLDILNALSDDLFRQLAGDYRAFAVCDTRFYYDREQRTLIHQYDPISEQRDPNYLTDYREQGLIDDFPVVCGFESQALLDAGNARLSGRTTAGAPRPFKGMPGAEYLTAVYRGDFNQQSTLAREYLVEMSSSIGGALAHLMGGLAQSRDARMAKQDLTVLEEVLSHYMTQYSRYGEACLNADWFERRFTRELPDDVTFDEFGIEIDRIDGGTSTTVFKLNKEFTEACASLCNTGGALVISAMAGNPMSQKKNYALGDVFQGTIDLLTDKGCSDPSVKQFESQLLKMYAKERHVPLPSRNTLGNILKR